ncbi:hypothetical protein AA12717_0279 [Gluconacetobacter sacchari DSM 12717]|uniref:BC1881 family protein n=3 Tax=Gluconacetobacter sacchari TaxID=92759 RepID=A0A7W4IAS0_9PROT|nr:BC1881 family protein [Gluconacetobacter sacchari]MBB2159364.1 BC1881 family protein [Gluconacetobacter sacchari]GBQ19520.1 hypothetical protein AA12717_0279 [Gluconacetobacter sacchari DSM 12717]
MTLMRADLGQGSSGIGLEGFSTCEIQVELSSRLGVSTLDATDPHDDIKISINGKIVLSRTGPAIISVNID